MCRGLCRLHIAVWSACEGVQWGNRGRKWRGRNSNVPTRCEGGRQASETLFRSPMRRGRQVRHPHLPREVVSAVPQPDALSLPQALKAPLHQGLGPRRPWCAPHRPSTTSWSRQVWGPRGSARLATPRRMVPQKSEVFTHLGSFYLLLRTCQRFIRSPYLKGITSKLFPKPVFCESAPTPPSLSTHPATCLPGPLPGQTALPPTARLRWHLPTKRPLKTLFLPIQHQS